MATRSAGPKGPAPHPPEQTEPVKPFDPHTATLEEAKAQPNAYRPQGAIHQFATAHELDEKRASIETGDGFDVLQGVAMCATANLKMPDWLSVAFLKRYRQVQQLHVGSWDDPKAFGRPYPKGAHLSALRRRRNGRYKAAEAFRALVESDPRRPVDKGLWEEIGRNIGEGATQAENLYREALRMGFAETASAIRNRFTTSARPAKLSKLAGVRRRR